MERAMMMDDQSPQTRQFLMTLRLLVGALAAGLLIFAAIAVFMGGSPSGAPPAAPLDVLPAIAWVIVACGLVAAFVLPRTVAGAMRRDETVTDDRRRSTFFVLTIISCAMIESGGLIGAVTTLLSGEATDAIVAGAAALAIALQFPTSGRWRRFVESSGGGTWPGGPGGPGGLREPGAM
jgi:hypothetical protein